MGMFFITPCCIGRDDWYSVMGVYIHIGVRLRVARFDEQAMRRPSMVERATSDWLHVFFYVYIIPFGASG